MFRKAFRASLFVVAFALATTGITDAFPTKPQTASNVNTSATHGTLQIGKDLLSPASNRNQVLLYTPAEVGGAKWGEGFACAIFEGQPECDQTHIRGFNLDSTGNRIDPTKPAIGESVEANFFGAQEWINLHKRADGDTTRWQAAYCNGATGACELQIKTAAGDIRPPGGANGVITWGATGGSLNSVDHAFRFYVDTTGILTVGPTGQVGYGGGTRYVGWSGSEIAMYGASGADASRVLANSSEIYMARGQWGAGSDFSGNAVEVSATGTRFGGPTRSTATGNGIADPGNGAAIDVTNNGVCNMTSGGSGQTRTLAIPTFVGQRISLAMDTDGGGDIVVTVASAFNQSANTTITFNDAGDHVDLVGVTQGGTRRWRLVVNNGCTLG